MKRFFPILLLGFLFAFSSCKKEELPPICETSTLRLTNISANPYTYFLNGAYQATIKGNTFLEFEIKEGKQTIKLVQESGYLLFPTIIESNVSVFGCEKFEVVFP